MVITVGGAHCGALWSRVEMEIASLLLVTFLVCTSTVTLAVPCEYDLYVSGMVSSESYIYVYVFIGYLFSLAAIDGPNTRSLTIQEELARGMQCACIYTLYCESHLVVLSLSGTEVLSVTGSDLDAGDFEFNIENAVPTGWWQVNTFGSTGIVTVLNSPDREHPVR